MADYRAIVDEMRFAIQSEDCELTDTLREANLQYVDACRDLNRRLRRVGELLTSGLRSEAIQYGEGPPNLVEMANILSFPELDEWNDVVSLYDLPRAEQLSVGIVEQLTEAQLSEHPLQQLLARHRRLALIRAPLRVRLDVLRQLTEADPETFVWQEDVREFERARFEEMSAEARQAHQAGDISQLNQILADLENGKWLEKPPKRIRGEIRKSLSSLNRQTARKQVQELAVELESAFSELDIDRARRLRTQWQAAITQAELAPAHELVQLVDPILGWVQDEDDRASAEEKYAQTISRLERALDTETTVEELERLENEIHRLGRNMPALLSTRYRHRLEAHKLGETRRHRVQLGSVVAALLLTILFVGFLVSRQLEINEVSAFVSHVKTLIDDGQYQSAQSALETRSDIARWDSLLALQSRLNAELEQEQQRIDQLVLELERAQDAKSYHAAMGALEQASQHVSNPDERLRLERLKRQWETQHNQEISELEDRVQQGIESITKSLVRAEELVHGDPENEELKDSLNDASQSLGEVRGESTDLRSELKNQITLLANRQQQLSNLRQQKLKRLSCFRGLGQHALIAHYTANIDGAVKAYETALISYADTQDAGQTVDALRASSREVRFWQAALEWSKFANRLRNIWPHDPTDRSGRIKTCQSFLDKFPGSPDTETIRTYIAQMTAMQARVAPVGTASPDLKRRIQRIFETPLLADSWCLETKEDRVFYLPKPLQIKPPKLFNFQYFVGYGRDDLRNRGDINPDNVVLLTTGRSPCADTADWVTQTLPTVHAENWNEFLLALAERIEEENKMSPFLKWDLLRRVLEMSGEGDAFLREELSEHVQLLKDASINPLARWMDPDDDEGKQAEEAARAELNELRRLESVRDVWKSAASAQAQFARNLHSELTMVGWLHNQGVDWTCETNWDSDGVWELYVVFTDKSMVTSQWRRIGDAVDGQLTIQDSAAGFLQNGRPVFAKRRIQEADVARR